jgi:putative intracellular protease/amidase
MRIVIPVYDQVDMLDVCGPCEMFHWAKFEVDLVAEKPGQVRFNSGLVFQVSTGLGPAKPADALWVPGGEPKSLARIIAKGEESAYLGFLKDQAAQSRRAGSARSARARCCSPRRGFSMAFR